MFCFSILRGEIIALGSYEDTEDDENHGNHAVAIDDRDPLHGYMNAYTEIEITVILIILCFLFMEYLDPKNVPE